MGSVQVTVDDNAHARALGRKLAQINCSLDELNAMAADQAAELHQQTAAIERLSVRMDARADPAHRQH